MASNWPQTIPERMPRTLIAFIVAPAIAAQPTASAMPNSGHGDHGGSVNGWADPYGYHIAAKSPEERQSKTTRVQGKIRSNDKSHSSAFCTEAAIGARVADPLAAMAGTPVTCGNDAPTITPKMLAQQAWNTLWLPLPNAQTAPPRGARGLVGLPEWVWITRRQWRPLEKRTAAGGVWARVTANPQRLVIRPGSGLPDKTCAGPGVAYDPRRPVSVQRTDCSYIFDRASGSLPGKVYRVGVSVVWSGSWTGSGGAGGSLPEITRSAGFSLRVGEAQGLYG
ncbi:hypothetical protein GCM10027176_51760 [Actinoallomurus bryophytorum]|uniref:Uncharacterized protein n=1 Tax=Actinoallomurus bryophytorum TaxID=1490222 RepID=A0A543CI54_9ACTN|nr:hypothetical protein FB559_2126 [Actinoallomurus bryophytorum]